MKTKLLALVLLAGSSMFAATRVYVGIGVGGYGRGYYAPPPAVVYAPPVPGPGYIWAPGYRYGAGPRRLWHSGYWAPRPYVRGYRYGYRR